MTWLIDEKERRYYEGVSDSAWLIDEKKGKRLGRHTWQCMTN